MHTFEALDLRSLDLVIGGADAPPSPPTTGQEIAGAAKRCAAGAATGAVIGGAAGAITGAGALPGAGLGAAAGCVRGIVNKVNPAY